MSTFNRHALSVVILLLPFLLCACGTEHRLVASYSPPPVGTHKFQTPVTLRLTHDFCDQECSFFVPGLEDWTLNLQPSLRDYAIYTARAEFADVEVLDVDSAAPPRRASRLVLRPQVAIRLEQDVPHAERNGFTLYGFELSATVSWTISDPESDQMFLSIPISSNWWEPFTFFSPEKFCSGLGSHFMTALTNDALPGFENAIKKFKELDSFNAFISHPIMNLNHI